LTNRRTEFIPFFAARTEGIRSTRKQVTEHGGQLLTNSIVCGVTMDGNRMTGIVVEREGSLSILTGDVVIDATGDGDVAAFAGAPFGYGIERMNATQNCSQSDIQPHSVGPSRHARHPHGMTISGHYL
jgi:flavin-dependent dehydrogenase